MKKILVKTRRGDIQGEIYTNEVSNHLYVIGHTKGISKLSIHLGNYNFMIPQDDDSKIWVYYASYSDGAYIFMEEINMPTIKGKSREDILMCLLCSQHNKMSKWNDSITDTRYVKKKYMGLIYQ